MNLSISFIRLQHLLVSDYKFKFEHQNVYQFHIINLNLNIKTAQQTSNIHDGLSKKKELYINSPYRQHPRRMILTM